MTATPLLFTGKRYTALLAVLPADADRDGTLGRLLKRERQYTALMQRTEELDRRVQKITAELPDATSKERTQLLAERRDLLAEREALPMDRTVAARLFADALTVFSSAVHTAVTAERHRLGAKLDETQKELEQARYAFRQLTAADDHEPAFNRLRDVQMLRQPDADLLDDLNELGALTAQYIQDVLDVGKQTAGHARVKLAPDGKPIDAHVAGFIEAVGRTVTP